VPRQVTPTTIVRIKLAAFFIASAVVYLLLGRYPFQGPFWEWGAIALGIIAYIVAKALISVWIGYLWGRQDARELKKFMADLPPHETGRSHQDDHGKNRTRRP
jgi:hypothetical protein